MGLISEVFILVKNAAIYTSENLESLHWIVEGVLFLFIIYQFVQKQYKPKSVKLTKKEEDELIEEWDPEPLVPQLSERQLLDLSTAPQIKGKVLPIGEVGGKSVVSYTSTSSLGLLVHEEVKAAAVSALRRYGTGSCGPRGFYGTIDVHLNLEDAISAFYGTRTSVIYSSHYACIVSIIMNMAGRHDVVVCDSGVRHAIKMGVDLSRAKTFWFEHNNMADLSNIWEKLDQDRKSLKYPKSTRFWVIVEGVYENYGDVCDIQELIRLKEKYCFRLMLEESNAVGLLGKTGRGTLEEFGIPLSDVECIMGSLGTSLSADGGYCTGDFEIVDFQRLNASGYVFSASLPPFLAATALKSLEILSSAEGQVLTSKLWNIVASFQKEINAAVGDYFVLKSSLKSSVQHLRLASPIDNDLEDERTLQGIVDDMLERGHLLTRAKYIVEWNGRPSPSIRIYLNSLLTSKQISKLAEDLRECAVQAQKKAE